MITLDQVLLLQNKIENAVKKIVSLEAEVKQLNSENDALRTKCVQLSNSLSEQAELVSKLEANQSKIESGILNALTRLDAVEDSAEEITLKVEPSSASNQTSETADDSWKMTTTESESFNNENRYELSAHSNPTETEQPKTDSPSMDFIEKTLETPNFIQDSLDLPPINFSSKTPEIDDQFDIF